MIRDGTYTAVVDRIEGEDAVLEVDGDDDRWELVVERDELPTDGRHADAILEVRVEDEQLVEAIYQPEETGRRRQRSQDRFDRLSRRPPGSDDETDE